MQRFANKVAVVTASTDGIGLAIAKRLAQEGAKVVVSSRKEENVQAAVTGLQAAGLTVSGIVANVANSEHRQSLIEHALETYGHLDVLVSNAAVNPVYGPTLDTPEAAWDKIFDVNVKSAFLLAKEAYTSLASRQGNILFVSSIAGYTPIPNLGPYSISKTALFGLTKVLATECGPNVRVNCLAPGIIKTKFSTPLQDTKVGEELLRRVPLERFGSPEEMAATAAFLCSHDADYVTGECLVAAGGMDSHL